MKKITFIVFALIAGTAFAQDADATAITSAEIVEALSITKDRDLNFGQIIAGNGAETVTIAATSAGLRSISTAANAPGVTPTSAQFTITASDYNYSISMTDTNLSGTDLTTMVLTPLSSLGTSSSGDKTLYVGGDLAVNASQEVGSYSGEIVVTVSYE